MARLARIVLPGIPYHVTHRGNRRQLFTHASKAGTEATRSQFVHLVNCDRNLCHRNLGLSLGVTLSETVLSDVRCPVGE